MRPGVSITSSASRPARGQPTDTGVAFLADFAERGPHDEAVEITSLDDFVETFGDRVSYSLAYDWLEGFFAEGGAVAYFARQVGPAPVKASLTLEDRAGSPLDTLTIEAVSYGDWANGAAEGLSVQIQDGTDPDTFRVIVFLNAVEVERFDNLVMSTASARYAPTILETSDYVRGTDEGSATAAPDDRPAVLARTSLAGGTDDHANAVQAQLDTALALLNKDLGPGQVAVPGRATQAVHEALITHGRTHNRTPALDAADSSSKATLIALAAVVDGFTGSEYAGLFGSWWTIPGIADGTVRSVPGSAYAAAVMNRVDALEGNSGTAAAGEASRSQYALGVKTPAGGFTEADYEDLNDAGVNMMREFRTRGIQLYGFRSVTSDPDWTSLTHTRLRMSQVARLEDVAMGFVFRPINAKTLADLKGALTGEMMADFNEGILYGDTPEEAFRVDTAAPINDAATAAARELNAEVYARYSEFAELVQIAVIKVPTTAGVGG